PTPRRSSGSRTRSSRSRTPTWRKSSSASSASAYPRLSPSSTPNPSPRHLSARCTTPACAMAAMSPSRCSGRTSVNRSWPIWRRSPKSRSSPTSTPTPAGGWHSRRCSRSSGSPCCASSTTIQEARNLSVFARNLREFERIVVPEPIADYTTSCVLTMQYVRGRKITAVSPLRLLEIDGSALGEEIFRAYLKQILVDGVFHADPHAGNVFLTDDNRIALIDLGMIGHVAPGLQDQLIK